MPNTHKHRLRGSDGTEAWLMRKSHRRHVYLGKVNRPTIFFYLAVAVVGAKISFIKSLSIFMKRETLQKRHKQSNKHVFRVCMHSYMYITKVTWQ